MIILDADQAEAVRGETAPGHALEPRPLADGSYALPDDVLTDPAHGVVWSLLASLPRREIADDEWLATTIE